MILDRVILTDFRCFERLELALDRHLNVFVGGNGAGKSAIIDALAIGLSPLLSALSSNVARFSLIPEIQPADIRLIGDDHSAHRATIQIHGLISGNQNVEWSLTGSWLNAGGGNRGAAFSHFDNIGEINSFASSLTERHIAGVAFTLPVFARYGTNRGHAPRDRMASRAMPLFFQRRIGLEDALDAKGGLRRSIAWFDDLERRELRAVRDREIVDRLPALDCARRAIAGIIDGIANPRIDGTTGRLVVDYAPPGWTKVKLAVDQLSDGYQVLLGVVMDFALRLALANPPDQVEGDPLAAQAILMIDEVDLHLHPAWQQEVVPRLRATFPNTQIILTTHSPQVLSTVEAKHIRQIARVGGVTTITSPASQTRGVASASVMAEVQHVDPVPRVEESELLNRYRALIAEGAHDSDEGRAIRTRLDAHFEPGHHLMLDLDRAIRFHDFKRRAAREKA